MITSLSFCAVVPVHKSVPRATRFIGLRVKVCY